MNLRDLAFGVIIISSVLLGATMMYSEMFTSYGVNETATNATSFTSSTLSKMYSNAENIQGTLNQSQPSSSSIYEQDSLTLFGNNIINAFFVIMDLPAITMDLVNNAIIALGFPVPEFITTMIFTLIVLFVMFEIVSGVLKWRV